MELSATERQVLESLCNKVQEALGERRHDGVVTRLVWAHRSKIIAAVSLIGAIQDDLRIPLSDLEASLSSLAQSNLIHVFQIDSSRGYLPSLMGYWTILHGSQDSESPTSEASILRLIVSALSSKWVKYTSSEDINKVEVPPRFASFLLFMLLGGAISRSHPLVWPKHSGEPAETARAILIKLCEALGQGEAAKQWKKRQELDNFTRRSGELIAYFGDSFLREDDETGTATHFLFDVARDTDGLVPLVRAVMRTCGSDAVFSIISQLDSQPWARDDAFRPKARYIKALFRDYVPDLPYRRALREAAGKVKQELEDPMESDE